MRFHSPDSWSPFGGGGLNAYMYCVGDPVNRADPTGHVPWVEPWLKKGAMNTFNFLSGGSEMTGPSRSQAIKATLGTGKRMSRETGDLAALSQAGKTLYAEAPTIRKFGASRPKGDGNTNGVKWGTTPSFVPSRSATAKRSAATNHYKRPTETKGQVETFNGSSGYQAKKETNLLQGLSPLEKQELYTTIESVDNASVSSGGSISSRDGSMSSISSGRYSNVSELRELNNLWLRLGMLERDNNTGWSSSGSFHSARSSIRSFHSTASSIRPS